MATVTPTQATSSSPLPAPDEVYRLSVEQFDQMIVGGTLGEDEAVELLNGLLVTKMPKNAPHRVVTRKTVRALEPLLPAGWIVQKEEAIVIPPGGKWEPDIAVVRSELEFDPSRDAMAADCCLVVEIADTNSRARSEKLPAYAGAGIPVYWVVKLAKETKPSTPKVEVYTDPDQAAGRYRTRVDFYSVDKVPVVIDGNEVGQITVTDLLP
jgi:Uma2 family endonuclease